MGYSLLGEASATMPRAGVPSTRCGSIVHVSKYHYTCNKIKCLPSATNICSLCLTAVSFPAVSAYAHTKACAIAPKGEFPQKLCKWRGEGLVELEGALGT